MSVSGKFILNFSSLHRFTRYVLAIFIFFITYTATAQQSTTSQSQSDTVRLKDIAGKDTTSNNADTSKTSELERKLGIKISKDALKSVVKATAKDSAVMNLDSNEFYLYGKAQVNFDDMQLNAGQVTFNQSSNIVTAAPYYAEKDTAKERPSFKQGSEKFTYDSMQYNFRSKRAIVRNVNSQYGEGYVHSEQVKRNPDQSIYGYHSVYTTCALDTPHFGILAKKIKVIPGRTIVSGPANLQIEGVPTPLYLPFGIFPVSQKQKSGFVLPTYTLETQRGLGLTNGGYYFNFSEKMDFLVQTNIFTKGSYMVSGMSNYNNLYHYQGAFNVSYAYNKTGEEFEPNASIRKDFMVRWNHNSDTRAIPGMSFRASVEAGSSNFYSQNSYDANQILRNQYQSNITFSKNWQNKPYGLTVSALHNQNTTERTVNVTLPSVNFFVNQFNPFQNKNAVGEHWYDKITASYTVDMQNRISFVDTSLNLATLGLRDMQNGIKHTIPVSATYKVFRYINMTFGVNYNEYWQTKQIYQRYNDATQRLDSTINDGFFANRDFGTNVSFATLVYGMKMFKRGSVRGIRHVIKPSIGLSFRPDFAKDPFNYYYQARTDTSATLRTLSPYPNSIIGGPSSGRVGSVDLSLGNNLQIKVRSKKDTVSGLKNVTIFDGFDFGTNYNMLADTFKWSNINVGFRTNVLEKLNISANAAYNPYAFDYGTGRVLPITNLEHGTGIARFQTANMSLGTNFRSKTKDSKGGPTTSQEYQRIMRNAGYNDYVDFNIPWSLNINYTMSANKYYVEGRFKDTAVTTHSLTFASELQLTERWKLTVNSGYNFTDKSVAVTNINVYRDLHCWQMHFQTIPFGPRKSFNFTINVKSAVLQDLKLVRRRDFRDVPQ